jgi:hypothetical protein
MIFCPNTYVIFYVCQHVMLCYHNLFTKIIPFTTICTHSFSFYKESELFHHRQDLSSLSSSLETTTTSIISKTIPPGLRYARLETNFFQITFLFTPHITKTLINFFKLCTIEYRSFDTIPFLHFHDILVQYIWLCPPKFFYKYLENFPFCINNEKKNGLF